jgi:hypothetical protein
MKLKEKSNHFYIYKNILNISRFSKNYKFRSSLRYFLKKNLYNLIKQKLLILLKFNNNLILNNAINININRKIGLNQNLIQSKTFNYLYVVKKEPNFNKKSNNFFLSQIKKFLIIKKNVYRRKKLRKIYNNKKSKIINILKLLKNIKALNINFNFYKNFFNIITIRRILKREILFKKFYFSKQNKIFKYKLKNRYRNINFYCKVIKKKYLNYKIYKNKFIDYKNLNKIKFKYISLESNKNNQKHFKFFKYIKNNKKITNIKKTLIKNILLITNIKNILTLTY